MDRKRLYQTTQQLDAVQKLRVAQEHIYLVDAQRETVAAEAEVNEQTEARDQVRNDLDQLLAGDAFCPTQYRINCASLLLAEAELETGNIALAGYQEAEAEQRITWHHNRQQSSWLSERASALHRKLARTEDDKRAIETAAMLFHAKGIG